MSEPSQEAESADARAVAPSADGPSQEDLVRYVLPHLEKAQACLQVAIVATRHGEDGIDPVIPVLTRFEQHYTRACQELHTLCAVAMPCSGTA